MKDILFRPTIKQFQAWEILNDHETTELGWGSGAGSGKTVLGCFWVLAMCLAYPRIRALIGRKELINLKRTTLATFWNVCAQYDVRPDVDYHYNQQLGIIKFNNGSEIVLFDLSSSPSDPEFTRLGGLELTLAFVDESNEVSEKAIGILKSRIGRQLNDKYNLLPRICETFNPQKNHVYTRYYSPWKKGTLPNYRKFVVALATDNPHLPKDYIQQLERSDKVTRERLLYGNFDYDSDAYSLMPYDNICDIFTNTVDKSDQKYITVDIARFGGDMTVIMVWRGMEAYRVEWMSHTALDAVVSRLRTVASEEQVPWSHILADESGIGGGVIDMMPGIKGFIGGSSPLPRKRDGQPENYKNLRAQAFFELANYVNDHKIAVRLDDAQMRERLSMELQQVKRINVDKDQKNQIVPKDTMVQNLGYSCDFADALSMRLYFEIKPLAPQERFHEKPVDWLTKEVLDYKKSQRKSLASKL